MFTRTASGFMARRNAASTRPLVSLVRGKARTTKSARGSRPCTASGVAISSAGASSGGVRPVPIVCIRKALERRATSLPMPPRPRIRTVEPARALLTTPWSKVPRRISSVRATTSFAAARRRAIACSATAVGSALRVAAGVAFDAALFENEGLATLRALRIQAFSEELRGIAGFLLELDVRLDRAVRLVVRLDGRLHAGLLHPDVPLDRLRDRVGDRVDAFAVVDRDPRAADPFELVDDLVDGDAGPQAEGGEAGDSLREGRCIPAAAADLGEDLEEALLVLVDRHIQRAVPGEDLLGAARDHVGPGPRAQGCGLLRDLDSHLRRLAGLRDADVQDLVLAG